MNRLARQSLSAAQWPHGLVRAVPPACAAVTALWAVAVALVGAGAHSGSLPAFISPAALPMGVTLGLAGAGAALVLQGAGRRALAGLAAVLPLAAGGGALLAQATSAVASTTWMPASYAIGLCLIAVAVLALLAPVALGSRDGAQLLAAVLGAVVLGLGLDAALSHIAGVQGAFAWGPYKPMGADAAIALVLLGGATWMLALQQSTAAHGCSPRWIALPVLAGALLATLGIWQLLSQQDAQQVHERVTVKAAELAGQLRSSVLLHEQALHRMAERLGVDPHPGRAVWEADAMHYLRDQPGTQTLEVLDDAGRVRWSMPGSQSGSAPSPAAGLSPVRVDVLTAARSAERPVLSSALQLHAGGNALIIAAPIAPAGGAGGALLANVRMGGLLQPLEKAARAQGFGLALQARGQEVLGSEASGTTAVRWGHMAPVGLAALGWSLWAWPTERHLRELHSDVPALGGALGLLFSLLLAAAVQYDRRARLRSQALGRANAHLQVQIDERQQAEERFRSVVEAAPNAIVIVSAKGRIELVNSQALRWFGYLREELVGQPIEVLVPETARVKHEALRRAYTDQPVTRPMGAGLALTARRKDGTAFPVDISLGPMHTRDGLEVIASITDVTQHKQAAAELEQANRALNALNTELESFAYAVSHDLRQPLRAMTGFSEIVLADYGERLDDQGRDYLRRIRGAANRMGDLIDALLRLSRITRAPLHSSAVDLSALAREVAVQLEQLDPQRRVQWAVADGLSCQGDAAMLRVLLENLLGNAWKFTARRGEACIEVGAEQDEGPPGFFVRDNGAGFDMAYADQLFGAFQRLHGVREFPGSGIGLATAQRIVHRHGGRIWAEGRVDAGAIFHFTL